MSTIFISDADLLELTRLIHYDQSTRDPLLSQRFALDWLNIYRDWVREGASWRPDSIWLQRETKTEAEAPAARLETASPPPDFDDGVMPFQAR